MNQYHTVFCQTLRPDQPCCLSTIMPPHRDIAWFLDKLAALLFRDFLELARGQTWPPATLPRLQRFSRFCLACRADMIRSLLRVTGVVAATTGTGVAAFVSLLTAPRAGCYGPGWSTRIATPASSTSLPGALPPQDGTFSPLAIVQEILAASEYPVGSQRYDRIGQETGGVWRSRVFGFLPCTVH